MSIEYRCPKKRVPTKSLEILYNAQYNKREYASEAVKSEAKSQKELCQLYIDKMQSGSFSISCIPGKSEPKETDMAWKARYWPRLLSPCDHHYQQNLPMTPGWGVAGVLRRNWFWPPHYIYTLSSHLACWAGTPPLPLETITLLPM